MIKKCHAVFEGGGVKGIGFVGAVWAFEEAGYSFENVVGTSAGAIIAALLAAGYSGDELKNELSDLDYTKFKQTTHCGKLGLLGDGVNLVRNYGIYSTAYFTDWLAGLLAKKGVKTFADLRQQGKDAHCQYRFQAVAADISQQQMLILPGDLKQFGIRADSLLVAEAVQMSISIPFFYQPYQLKTRLGKTHYIVDGGLLSNYPIWLLDDGSSNPLVPTFGFKFTAHGQHPHMAAKTDNIIDYSKNIVATLLEGHDNYYISTSKGDYQRSIMIPTEIETSSGKKMISSTDFDISEEESVALYQNGYDAAKKFLHSWNFAEWKRKFR